MLIKMGMKTTTKFDRNTRRIYFIIYLPDRYQILKHTAKKLAERNM